MHQALVVCRRQTFRELCGIGDRLTGSQRADTEPRPQCLAVEQPRHGKRDTLLAADVMNGENVRVGKCCDGPGAIDLAHTARAEGRRDHIRAEAKTRCEGHGRAMTA